MLTSTKILSYFDNDLLKIKDIIKNSLKDNDKNIKILINKLAITDGKMIRALLVLIGSSFGNIKKEAVSELAAGIEILHLATLIHDDIVDESDLRRGKVTLNASHGTKIALFMGDYIFSQSFMLFSNYAAPKSIYAVSETIKIICKWEINQFLSTYNLNSNVKEYLRRINGKCASLFSLSLSIGAYENEAEGSVLLKLKKIGYYSGMAFQLIDDILDITTEKFDALGKPSENDIKKGIYSLPIILEVRKGNKALIDAIESNDYDKATEILKNSEGLLKSKEIAKKYTVKAMALIEQLPEKHEKYILKGLIEFLLTRTY